jgi:Flp pilus assembly protein TadD
VRKGWTFCPICGDDPNVEEEEEDPEEEGLPLRVDLPAAASISPAAAPRAGSAEALNQAGVRAYEAENYREAVRLFREASEADPSNSSYFTNLGVACGELDDDLGAFAAYLRAVDLNPQELQAYLNMGTLYAERERPVEAREVWERLIRIAPNSEEASEARENLRHIDYV